MSASKTYKLFVWNSVLCDYSCGIAFAVARDETEARELLKKRLPDYLHHDIEKTPKIVYLTKPYSNYVFGGSG